MISVIIPAYNVAPYIEECLDSVISQIFADLEIIVVDDGSTDATPQILRQIADTDSRIRIITQPNRGLSEARNAGLDVARGEWVLFVDGDDMLLPDAVQTLVDLARRSDAEIACGGFVTRREDADRTIKEKEITLTPDDAVCRVLYQQPGFYNSAWGKLYRRDLFDDIRYRAGVLYEDLDIFYLLFEKASKIAFTNRPVAYYRPNNQSILHTFNERRLDVLDVTDRIVDWATKKSSAAHRAAIDRRLSAAFNMLGLMVLHGDTGRFERQSSRCWSLIKKYRFASFFNPRVRLKNKVGIIFSMAGKQNLERILKKHYSEDK